MPEAAVGGWWKREELEAAGEAEEAAGVRLRHGRAAAARGLRGHRRRRWDQRRGLAEDQAAERGVRAEPGPGGEPGGPGPGGRGGAGARGGGARRARRPEQGPRQAAGAVAAAVQQRVLVADARRQPPRPAHRPPAPHHARPGVPEDRRGQQGLRQHRRARARRAVAVPSGRGHGHAGAQVRGHRDLGDQDHVREDDGEDQGEPVAAAAAGGAPHPRQPPAAVQHRERRVRSHLPRRRHPHHPGGQGRAQGLRHLVSSEHDARSRTHSNILPYHDPLLRLATVLADQAVVFCSAVL